MRTILVTVCLLVVCLPALSQAPDSLWEPLLTHNRLNPQGYAAAHQILEQYPPNPSMVGNQELETQYALVATMVAYDLGERQRQYGEAVQVAQNYFAVFSNLGEWASQVDTLLLRYLRKTDPPAEQALQAANFSVQRLQQGAWPPCGELRASSVRTMSDGGYYLGNIVALYERAGQPGEGIKFLQNLPVDRPDLLDRRWFWDATVSTYVHLGREDLAKQAAVMAFREAPFTQEGINWSLDLLVKALVLGGEYSQMEGFLQYLKTGEGENPLASIPRPELTEEQRQQMVFNAAAGFHPLVSAHLYAGQFDEAVRAAQIEVVSAGNNAARGVADLARCFKARDMHLLRANRFVEWVKTGEGQNPLEEL